MRIVAPLTPLAASDIGGGPGVYCTGRSTRRRKRQPSPVVHEVVLVSADDRVLEVGSDPDDVGPCSSPSCRRRRARPPAARSCAWSGNPGGRQWLRKSISTPRLSNAWSSTTNAASSVHSSSRPDPVLVVEQHAVAADQVADLLDRDQSLQDVHPSDSGLVGERGPSDRRVRRKLAIDGLRPRPSARAPDRRTSATRVSTPPMIRPYEALQPRNGKMLMITLRNSAPTTAPMNEPRPPSRLAPPSTAAAMLVSVKLKPAFGSPICTWAARKKPPDRGGERR